MAYYRRWASVFGPNMSECIDRILKAAKHEEQAYNSCAGLPLDEAEKLMDDWKNQAVVLPEIADDEELPFQERRLS